MTDINRAMEDFGCTTVLPIKDVSLEIGFNAGVVAIAGGVMYGLYKVVFTDTKECSPIPGTPVPPDAPWWCSSKIIGGITGIGVALMGYGLMTGTSHAKLDTLAEKVQCGWVKETPEIRKKLERRTLEHQEAFIHQPREVYIRNRH